MKRSKALMKLQVEKGMPANVMRALIKSEDRPWGRESNAIAAATLSQVMGIEITPLNWMTFRKVMDDLPVEEQDDVRWVYARRPWKKKDAPTADPVEAEAVEPDAPVQDDPPRTTGTPSIVVCPDCGNHLEVVVGLVSFYPDPSDKCPDPVNFELPFPEEV